MKLGLYFFIDLLGYSHFHEFDRVSIVNKSIRFIFT